MPQAIFKLNNPIFNLIPDEQHTQPILIGVLKRQFNKLIK